MLKPGGCYMLTCSAPPGLHSSICGLGHAASDCPNESDNEGPTWARRRGPYMGTKKPGAQKPATKPAKKHAAKGRAKKSDCTNGSSD